MYLLDKITMALIYIILLAILLAKTYSVGFNPTDNRLIDLSIWLFIHMLYRKWDRYMYGYQYHHCFKCHNSFNCYGQSIPYLLSCYQDLPIKNDRYVEVHNKSSQCQCLHHTDWPLNLGRPVVFSGNPIDNDWIADDHELWWCSKNCLKNTIKDLDMYGLMYELNAPQNIRINRPVKYKN